jgi:hypothetical protein
MTFTVSLTELLLVFMALVLTAGTFMMFFVARRVRDTADSVTQVSAELVELMPSVRRLLDEATTELNQLQQLTTRTTSVAENVDAMTGEMKVGVTALKLARRSQAAVSAAKAGLAMLNSHTENNSTNGGRKDERDER